mmetsp:Transcript_168707/g.536458  ORF Transcript_168707/g.536458 Transcript_168707/m.536458 type:complete len:193 (-) Transcript_168707:227-805(-)
MDGRSAPPEKAGSETAHEGDPSRRERHGWAAGWDSSSTMSASPRWTFSKSLFVNASVGSATPRTGSAGAPKHKHRVRDTFVDEMLRADQDRGLGPSLGPGSHDPLPVERVFMQPEASKHGPVATPRRNAGAGAGGQFSKVARGANLSSLRQYPRSALPSSADNPGPGAYTQYSSFGAASGPTRTRFYPKATT